VSHDPGPAFNLARNWSRFGHPSDLSPGAIVVKSHHVERVVKVMGNGMFIAIAGNTGHGNSATEYHSSLRGVIAIRRE